MKRPCGKPNEILCPCFQCRCNNCNANLTFDRPDCWRCHLSLPGQRKQWQANTGGGGYWPDAWEPIYMGGQVRRVKIYPE